MPRMVAEIKNFGVGIVATPDSKDIPTDASDYSLDVEPVASDGMVKGRKKDAYSVLGSGFSGTANNTSRVRQTIYYKRATA
jgi:hypothetical protein|tara:strand:- start:149 stop:391 length:243 start_codon:yes stop_codon:yes gene_type:complete